MEKKDNSGVLFKNDRKEQDNHPDYRGSATIDGVDLWMSAWIKKGEKGTYMSFAFREKDEQRPITKNNKKSKFDDDDIPF